MTQANFLSIDDLINELSMGRATVNFVLRRFGRWIVPVNGEHLYSPSCLPVLSRIRDLLEAGILPLQIETMLEAESAPSLTGNGGKASEETAVNTQALELIQSLLQNITGHQDRIALAQEKRAEAELKKVAAIEKRAVAEEKKAAAMNHIAMALQEMCQQRTVDAHAMEIAGQAARALTLEESELGAAEDGSRDLEELLDHPMPQPIDPLDLDGLNQDGPDQAPGRDMDDLSLLVDAPGLSSKDLDDLSALIDTVSGSPWHGDSSMEEDLDGLLDQDLPLPEADDLSLLVDPAPGTEDLDDLYSLVDPDHSPSREEGLDDLWTLVNDPMTEPLPRDMDDLSALVDTIPEAPPAPDGSNREQIDDLNLLIDRPQTRTAENDAQNAKAAGDDLWALVDGAEADLDDLSALVDAQPPSLKPKITPEEDLAKYKAAVTKIIIDLKSQGLNPAQTTERLNRDGIVTLSGKPRWGESAIAKIYGFIDSAR